MKEEEFMPKNTLTTGNGTRICTIVCIICCFLGAIFYTNDIFRGYALGVCFGLSIIATIITSIRARDVILYRLDQIEKQIERPKS